MLILEHALLQIKMATSTGINRDRSQIRGSALRIFIGYIQRSQGKRNLCKLKVQEADTLIKNLK